MPNYCDYNSTPVLYLISNLGSNFYVQNHIDNDNYKDNSLMSNLCIFMRIINAFLLIFHITYAGGEYINDCFVHNLTYGGYIQLDDANLVLVNLLYPKFLCLLVEFY
jgi:hypothetical protein